MCLLYSSILFCLFQNFTQTIFKGRYNVAKVPGIDSLDTSAHHNKNGRYFSGWLGSGSKTETPRTVSKFYLPATLQVLEHTASHVNGTWDSEVIKYGGKPFFEELKPLPGLVRLSMLRNSLLAEAKAAKLDQFEGFSDEVEERLQRTNDSPLPEQLASVIEFTLQAGELEAPSKMRGQELLLLAMEMTDELRDARTLLSKALRQYPPLRYS